MKPLLLILTIFTITLISCTQQAIDTIEEPKVNIKASWGFDAHIRLIEIDSCEYIVSTKTEAISTIHKQNCKYCSQRNSLK